MTTTEQKENVETTKNSQSPETEIEVDKWLGTEKTKIDTQIDAKKLKTTVKKNEEETTLTEEQETTKAELEKDLAGGMKVSDAIGKRSTRLDTMDSRLTILPFVGDTMTSSASLLFFITQNQRLSKKYRLPRTDKFKAMLLQVGDWTFETLIKAPLNSIMMIPVLWWIAGIVLYPVNTVLGFVADSIFKANKWTAKLFTKSFENMLADAKQRNKDNPDKEQIDIVGMKSEMDDNLKKIESVIAYQKEASKKAKKSKKKKKEEAAIQDAKDKQENELQEEKKEKKDQVQTDKKEEKTEEKDEKKEEETEK
jgi:hypothetical protein